MIINRNKVFISVEQIGDLFLQDVLINYLYPRSFICKDIYDSYYVFYEMDYKDRVDTWLVAKITKTEYWELIWKKITIQSVYLGKSHYQVFTISKNHNNNLIELKYNSSEWIDFLPSIPVFSEAENETLDFSLENKCPILDIRLFPGTENHFVPVDIMSSICDAIKKILKNISNNDKCVPNKVLTAEGSCVLRFAFTNISSDDEIELLNSARYLFDKMISQSTFPIMSDISVTKAFFDSYKKLMDALAKTNYPIVFTVSVPVMEQSYSLEVYKEDIASQNNNIRENMRQKEKEIVIKEKFSAVNLKKKTFSVRSDNKVYYGRIGEKVISKMSIDLNKEYNITISQIDYYVDDSIIKTQYTLKDFEETSE